MMHKEIKREILSSIPDGTEEITLNAFEAIELFNSRQHGKGEPSGYTLRGKWFANAEELRNCCNSVQSPSSRRPNILYEHCRSFRHACHVFGVPEIYAAAIHKEIKILAKKYYPAAEKTRLAKNKEKLLNWI